MINGGPSISDRSVLQIADYCPALETLSAGGMNNDLGEIVVTDGITVDGSLGALGAKCLKLTKIEMNGSTVFSR